MKKTGVFFVGIWVVLGLGILPAGASDLEAGKTVFKKKRCGMCHIIEGSGGKIASNLSGIGSKRDREWLLKFFENPKKLMSNAKMRPVKGSEKELSALADYLLAQK